MSNVIYPSRANWRVIERAGRLATREAAFSPPERASVSRFSGLHGVAGVAARLALALIVWSGLAWSFLFL